MKQKAQVPLLILALAVLLLVYVYFLPLSEKCKILSMPECTQLTGRVFYVSPGTVEVKENKVEYNIPDIDLFTVGAKEMNTLAESIEVKKGWFYSYSPKLSFEIHEKSKNVNIFVYLTENKKAKLKVNGETVAVLETAGQHIVPIPSKNLQKSNIIEIYPSTPFFPWNVNKLNIGKVIYEETYTLTQEKVTHQVNIKESLKDIASAALLFKSTCFYNDTNLSITINKTEIVNGIICGDFEKDISSHLKEINNISFFSKGNYFLYHARLELKLKQETWPTYYFDLLEKKNIHILSLNLPDSGEKKFAVYINEKSFAIETSDNSWGTEITDYLKVGQNKIVIIPAKTVNISGLEIY